MMDAHGFHRLPVVDRGKLMGIVTKDSLEKAGPSQLTTFSVHEIGYLLHKMKVRDVMRRDVLTGPPDMSVEDATAL
jgi:acetoin utilization protein AcuB